VKPHLYGDCVVKIQLAPIEQSTATLSFRDNSDRLLMTSDVLGGLASVSKDDYVVTIGKKAQTFCIKMN